MGDRIPGKTIILCFDGTTNQYSTHNSNIARLYSMLSKNDPSKQATYYQVGIGQYYPPGRFNRILEPIAQMMDWGFGWSLSQHVTDGYRFLVQNWKEGDEVLIFGFSRGAYTARCVAGMVKKVGLIAKDNDETLTLAYRLYERVDEEGERLAAGFKYTYSRIVPIHFVGVFDTVASIGMFTHPVLPFTDTNHGIRTFRHVLSLDERRSRFYETLYTPVPPTPGLSLGTRTFGLVTFRIPPLVATIIWTLWYCLLNPGQLLAWFTGLPSWFGSPRPTDLTAAPFNRDTDVKEVWFAGCHEDVGGSAVRNTVESSLSNITLRWMVSEIIGANLQIPVIWRKGVLEKLFSGVSTQPGIPLKFDLLQEKSQTIDPRIADAEDAMTPIHDPLSTFPWMFIWWGLEVLPDYRLYQDSKDTWLCQLGVNLGRGRLIDVDASEPTVFFHDTVRLRMEKLGYKPRAVYDTKDIRYVPSDFPSPDTVRSQASGL